MSQQALLAVSDLHTSFFTQDGEVKAVDGVSFSVQPGEILGIVGESGSGKSITAYSLLGLIDKPGKITAGSIKFKGQQLRDMPANHLRQIRGKSIAMVFQDPALTLNPTLRLDTQMVETLFAHQSMSKIEALNRSLEALKKLHIPAPEMRLKQYPHQLSGGMRQRVAIAIAMLHEPELIIADEPTTALDVTTQSQVLAQMQQLCRASGSALIWITHDLSLLAEIADRICVMYAGKIVEEGSVDDIIDTPHHPYTKGLLASLPSPETRQKPLQPISGVTPSLLNLPTGCAFGPRCDFYEALCDSPPAMRSLSKGHKTRCHKEAEMPEIERRATA